MVTLNNIIIKKGIIKDVQSLNDYITSNKINFDSPTELHIIKNYLETITLDTMISTLIVNSNNLVIINLTANNITKIPESFLNLTNLKTLVLNNNKISVLENMDNMKELTRLELRNNRISDLSYLIIFEKYNKIEKITLSSNQINKLESSKFPRTDSLQELGLFGNYLGDNANHDNNLKILNEIILTLQAKAPSLEKLYLSGNYFLNIKDYKTLITNSILSLKFINGEIIFRK